MVLDRRLDRRSEDRPALVMVLAPLLGLAIWAATAFLVIGWPL